MITHIALVLPVPVDVVDGEGVGVADLGVLEPLDVTLEGEELSVGSRIEREQTVSTSSVRSREEHCKRTAAAILIAGCSAFHSHRCSFSSLGPTLLLVLR